MRSYLGLFRKRAWREENALNKKDGGGRGSSRDSRGAGMRGQDQVMDVCLDLLTSTIGKETASSSKCRGGPADRQKEEALAEIRQLKAKTVQEIPGPLLATIAPLCPHHRHFTKVLEVKRAGPNKGRRFYVCGFPRG